MSLDVVFCLTFKNKKNYGHSVNTFLAQRTPLTIYQLQRKLTAETRQIYYLLVWKQCAMNSLYQQVVWSLFSYASIFDWSSQILFQMGPKNSISYDHVLIISYITTPLSFSNKLCCLLSNLAQGQLAVLFLWFRIYHHSYSEDLMRPSQWDETPQ